jgi:hypothetical protein
MKLEEAGDLYEYPGMEDDDWSMRDCVRACRNLRAAVEAYRDALVIRDAVHGIRQTREERADELLDVVVSVL